MEHVLGLERLLQVVDQRARHIAIDVVDAQPTLYLLESLLGGRDGVLCLIHLEVLVGHESTHRGGKVLVGGCRLGAGTTDDERGTGLVNKNRVDLVDDGIVMATLNTHVCPGDHVVAQVVEAELRVRAVGDVCGISGLLEPKSHAVLEQTHRHAHKPVDAAHPLAVALGQVVVDGNDVDALTLNGVEVSGEGGDERLALARLHLGNGALVQGDAAHQLYVEVPLTNGALRRLAHGGERLGQQVIETLAIGVSLTELGRLATQLGIVHLLELRLKVVHSGRYFPELLELLIGTHGKNSRE